MVSELQVPGRTEVCVVGSGDGQTEGKAATMADHIRYWRSIRITIRAAPQGTLMRHFGVLTKWASKTRSRPRSISRSSASISAAPPPALASSQTYTSSTDPVVVVESHSRKPSYN